MKLTWQHVVLFISALASLLLAARLGSVAIAAVGGLVTTVVGVFIRSPQDAKELQ